MHHCHVNSTSRRHVDRVLENLDAARAAGSRVTVEAYPYGMGSTSVGAAFLAPDRLRATGLTPSSIVMLGTGERIADDRRLLEIRAADPAATCFVEFLDERDEADRARLRRALAFPDSIVASDAMPLEWPDHRADTREWPLPAGASTHPRTAGTFARSLRLMVREHGAVGLGRGVPALLLPAGPRARRGGSRDARARAGSRPGADADLVVLDPGGAHRQRHGRGPRPPVERRPSPARRRHLRHPRRATGSGRVSRQGGSRRAPLTAGDGFVTSARDSGVDIARTYYFEVVRPLLALRFPGMPHAAGRLGGGSDVLGLDDETSRDHDWGLRLNLFVPPA